MSFVFEGLNHTGIEGSGLRINSSLNDIDFEERGNSYSFLFNIIGGISSNNAEESERHVLAGDVYNPMVDSTNFERSGKDAAGTKNDACERYCNSGGLTRSTLPLVGGIGVNIIPLECTAVTASTAEEFLKVSAFWVSSSAGPRFSGLFKCGTRFPALFTSVRIPFVLPHAHYRTTGGCGGGGGDKSCAGAKKEKLSWPSKDDRYVGEVQKNADGGEVPHGKGRCEYGEGVMKGWVYEGDWVNGLKNGKGTMENPEGIKFEGKWQTDQLNGTVRVVHKDGRIFEGIFKSHFLDGKAIFKTEAGDMLYVVVQHGKMSRNATVEYFNGDTYVGESDFFTPHGLGVLTNKSGRIIHSGAWDKGKPIK